MDLSQYEQQDEFTFTLKAPNGDVTDIVFTLAGPTHPVRVVLEKRQQSRRLREYNRKGKPSLPEDPDDLVDVIVNRCAVFTLGWTNLAIEGKPVEYSASAADNLYRNESFAWVREQIAAALNDVELFTQSSSAS